MPEYFLILIVLLVMTIILHRISRVKIYNSKGHFLALNLIVLAISTVWDQYAIYRGHWSFGKEFLLGPKIGFMPVEEFLFVLILSYFGLVLYKILEKRFNKRINKEK